MPAPMTIPTEELSFVKGLQHFFTDPPTSKKIEVSEFKELTEKDKIDFVNMLNDVGYNITPYVPKSVTQ